jgi:hypothetical protein
MARVVGATTPSTRDRPFRQAYFLLYFVFSSSFAHMTGVVGRSSTEWLRRQQRLVRERRRAKKTIWMRRIYSIYCEGVGLGT